MTLRLKRVKKNCLRRKKVGDDGLLDSKRIKMTSASRGELILPHQEAHIVGNLIRHDPAK